MILDPAQLLIFVPAALALNLTPGSDMMFCLAQGIKAGPHAGVAASFGVATGGLVHTFLAAFGLAALIAANPVAFEVIRWFGVAYLVFIAVQAFRNPVGDVNAVAVQKGSVYRAWRDAVFVNLFNPKVVLFVLAFVPQFVDPARGSTVLQFIILCTILNIGGTIINALVGAFSGTIGNALARNRRLAQFYRYVSSTIFIGLAAKLAFDRN